MADATATPTPAPVAEKAKRVPMQTVYPSAEAAIKEAQSRTKGPRRAFKTVLNGKELYIVHVNEGRAGGVAFETAGGKVEELGRAPRAAKPMGPEAVLAAVQGLPEADRKAVLDQLKTLLGAKK
jgi:hypothetical protein